MRHSQRCFPIAAYLLSATFFVRTKKATILQQAQDSRPLGLLRTEPVLSKAEGRQWGTSCASQQNKMCMTDTMCYTCPLPRRLKYHHRLGMRPDWKCIVSHGTSCKPHCCETNSVYAMLFVWTSYSKVL